MSDKRRQQLLIDGEVQYDLVWQALRFWGLCVLSTGLFLCVGIALFGEQRSALAVVNELFFKYGPAAAASIIVMPLVLMDVFRHSNRFAGPIYRLRSVLQKIAQGERVGPVNFRDDDYWHDLADDFNRVLERLQGPESTVAAAAGEESGKAADCVAAPALDTVVEELPTFPVLASIQISASGSQENSPTIVG